METEALGSGTFEIANTVSEGLEVILGKHQYYESGNYEGEQRVSVVSATIHERYKQDYGDYCEWFFLLLLFFFFFWIC